LCRRISNWQRALFGFWLIGSLFSIGFIALTAGTDGTALAIVPPAIAGLVAKNAFIKCHRTFTLWMSLRHLKQTKRAATH
jgi:hypothetical protein